MRFSSIPGLAETKQKLVSSVKNNHLAHALLFHGPEGSATLPMALGLASFLYCENPTETDSCGTCAACHRLDKLILPDLNFAFPQIARSKKEVETEKIDDMANWRKFAMEQPYGNIHDFVVAMGMQKKQLNISKDEARKIIQTLSLKSFEGGFKTMMIWGVEHLHPSAANSLLKIIEEPPEKTLFLLITNDPEKLLTTILSRTQKVFVRGFSDQEIAEHLVSEFQLAGEKANQIAILSDGSMREAYRLRDEVKDQQVQLIRQWFLKCAGLKVHEIFPLVTDFDKSDVESQKSLILTGLFVLREILLKRLSVEDLLRTQDEDRVFIEKISKVLITEEDVPTIYQKFNEAYYHLERNINAKFVLTVLLLDVLKIAQNKQRNGR
ncbi:DNA polymerase III subunit [Algoriphagus namhaensis]